MRRVIPVAFLSVCLVGFLSACKAGGNSYSVFYTPADHVAELLVSGMYAEGSTVYASEETWFASNGDDLEVQALLENLATGLKNIYGPKLRRSMAEVRNIEWPIGLEHWDVIKNKLRDLDVQVSSVKKVQLFKNPRYGYELANDAEQLLKNMRTKIAQYAPTAFTQYPLKSADCFFSVYPVDLKDQVFIAEQKEIWAKTVQHADNDDILRMYASYGNILPDDMQQELAQAYFKSLCPTVKKTDFDDIMIAYGKVQSAGMHLDSIPGIEIAFLEVTSDTLKKRGAIEFPIGVEMDMPFKTVNADLKKGFESPSVKSADIVVLFNLATTRTSRKVDTSNYVKSTYLAGYNKVNNPEWDVLQVELQQANMEVMTNSSGELSTNTGNPYTDFGNALANFGKSMKVNEAKGQVEELKNKFRETPRYIDEPVYESYQFQRVEMDVLKSGSIQYYIIDQRNHKYYSDFFDVTSKEFFTVAYDLIDNDPDIDRHMKTNVTESIVDDFEKEPVTVNLSELLENYSSNDSKAKRYTSLSAIRKDVVKNRNIAIAKMKDNEYGFEKQDDKRFESVVVVLSSKGLGTGFYVADNIVLTNYHVVQEQKFVELKKWGDMETFGKVIAKDVRLDLALIKVQDRGVPVKFYSDKNVKIGETVEAIGHPEGHQFTLTRGIISTVREHETVMGVHGKPVLFIQTDTPINHGNSGGPLFIGNCVVGVNDWGISKSIAEGLNFSIHYSEVFKFLKDNNINYKKG